MKHSPSAEIGFSITAILLMTANGYSKDLKIKNCEIPAGPINWITKYCGFVVGTDDEVAIQKSESVKNAEQALSHSAI